MDFAALVTRAAAIGEKLKARGEKVAVSESSSGGLISAALLAIPGASAYYIAGGVVYTRKAREELLDIPAAELKGIRSASEPYAALLARTLVRQFGTTWGLSETGASGPTGNGYGDAPGHSCLAICGPVTKVITLETGHGDRVGNMQAFAAAGLDLLLQGLQQIA